MFNRGGLALTAAVVWDLCLKRPVLEFDEISASKISVLEYHEVEGKN